MKNGKSDKQLKNTSKFISLVLRHQPEAIGIALDEHGWADVQELIDGINRSEGHILTKEENFEKAMKVLKNAGYEVRELS